MANLRKQKIPFTQVANKALNDKKLSWKAKGLFAYLFSKPEGWDFAVSRIHKEGKDGKDSVYAGLKELEDLTYIIRVKQGNGRVSYLLKWDDYDDIDFDEKGYPIRENPKQGKSLLGKIGTISNTDSESNKEVKEISTKVLGAKAPDTRISLLIDFLKEKVGGSLDGTQQDNRRYCYLLLNRFLKDFPARDPVELVKGLITGAVSDDFHVKNTAGFRYLYYNAQKIILSITKKKSNKIIGL